MNFENYLSFKKALRIAMPCFALSFLLASCSNEDIMEVSDETTSSVTDLTLTATVPVAKQNSLTRIGIKDGSDAANYVWIEGDKLTLYWKNLSDSSADRVIEYKVEGVTNDGQSCTMNPVGNHFLANGFYKIHSLSPHTGFNFVNNELKATIDLGNQNQPNNAVNHAYLADKMYQYATTVVQVHGGSIVSGTTNLPFEFITSLMRVRVVNNSGLPINVSKVSLSYSTANNPQFYSKGIFTAADPVGTHGYAATADATLNDLSVTTSKALNAGENFDVYMSFFPTEGYSTGSAETLKMVVEYEVSGTAGDLTRNVSVLNNAFKTGNTYLTFEGGDLYPLTLTVQGSDLPDGVEPPPAVLPFEPIEVVGLKISPADWIPDGLEPYWSTASSYPLFPIFDVINFSCPSGYHVFAANDVVTLYRANSNLGASLNVIGYPFGFFVYPNVRWHHEHPFVLSPDYTEVSGVGINQAGITYPVGENIRLPLRCIQD